MPKTNLQPGGIDPAKVNFVVFRCPGHDVHERDALAIVVEIADRYGVELTTEEEAEAVHELLARPRRSE